MTIITSDVVVAYSQCPRKAFLLLCSDDQGTTHEYVSFLEEQARRNRVKYYHRIEQGHPGVCLGNSASLSDGVDVLLRFSLRYLDLAADCDVLTKVHRGSSRGSYSYEPTIIVGTHKVAKEHKLTLLFIGYVLGKLKDQLPAVGTIVGADNHAHKVYMESADRTLIPMIKVLRQWTGKAPSPPPPVLLNKHCPTCQFQEGCVEQAQRADDLSLLDRITPKTIRKYHKKGIFQ